MVQVAQWVVARTAAKRPTLMHAWFGGDKTACGVDLLGWSKYWSKTPIPAITCFKCARHSQ